MREGRVAVNRDGWQVTYWSDGSIEVNPPFGPSNLLLDPGETRALINGVVALNAQADEMPHDYGQRCPICRGAVTRADRTAGGRRFCSLGHEWRLGRGGFAIVERS